ncbi:putative DNA repair protein YkoV [Streptomyces sp. YIM 121038]|uniref:non-homologous end joining protein Ku n=1 Tax=Streptomyces sp. YIM 121038 TaxID=2136401 RepID=UPI0011622669|nr:Ku protein [Streptomyces sp. YIM 121038]QCX79095.1 putative DNA repair protein YkoV [Streptomyces sp. YIM 121038]
MRSIWNGAISFGLVSIPIKLVNATESHSISFRQIHTEDGGRIRYRKVCELEDREVPTAEIGKGYEDADGSVIPITEDDLASLPIPTAKTIEIVSFVPADRIDPLQMDTAYYLSANGVPAAKPYTLLREALKRSDRVAIAKFALRGRERLGMLRVVDDVIAMHGLLWPDEIRATDSVAPDASVTVRDAELDLADALMDTLGEVDLDSLHDDYRTAVEEMIAAKVEGGTTTAPEPAAEPGGGKVIDLMAALENSVRAARTARGEAEGGKEAEVTELPTRRSARTTPKQVGGKKSTTARKTTAAAPKKSTAKTATKKTATTRSTATKSTATKSTAKSTATTAKKAPTKKKTATAKKTPAKRRAS